MAKRPSPQPDVLVLGEHPSAYLAAALLRAGGKTRVVHATIPGETAPDRLVLVNPRLFDLHPLLSPLARKIESRAVYGLRFVGDDAATHSEYRTKSALVCVAQYKHVRDAMRGVAESQDVAMAHPRQIRIHRLDEQGLDITLGSDRIHPKALVLAGRLSGDQERLIGMPESWENGILHRQTYLCWRGAAVDESAAHAVMPISLDLDGKLAWAWLIPGKRHTQIAVQQLAATTAREPALPLMERWAEVLRRHGLLSADARLPLDHAQSMDVPLAGALAHEGVANRTLLIGPAGGFFSASGEDIYPNCWSAVYAADVLKKALKEPHLQDALQHYRHKWRTTLGEYMRGVQQNLRFLLPLVYRNPVMTARLAEAILQGKSVVR